MYINRYLLDRHYASVLLYNETNPNEFLFFSFLFFFFFFLGPYQQHMEVPRLGVKSELQLPAYATATAMPDLSRICDLHHGNTRSLTHWATPGIEPATSWFLVRFVSTTPQREFPNPNEFKSSIEKYWKQNEIHQHLTRQ